jgi:hypothetical protein
MSHHFDTAIAREDPRLNLLDFYLFCGQPGTTVMAMSVNPNAGTKAPDTFHEEGLYAFRFDVNDDAHEEVTFKIRFGEAEHAEGEGPEGRRVQTLEVRRATGRDAAEGTGGEVIASGTTGRIVADALARVTQLAGSTDDPAAYAQRVVERLFPTTLPYLLDSAASFGFAGFNGRAMTDNVENVMLSLQANTPIDQGAAVARTNILAEFPYFGAPHADPIVD